MLEGIGTTKKYQDGEIVFKEGDTAKEMYIIRSGKVKIFRNKEGRQVNLATLGPNDFFGEMALFRDNPRSASAQAVDDTELSAIDKGTFMSFIKEPIVWTILERMSDRIREVDDNLEELSVQDQVRKEHLSSILARRRTF